MTDKTLRDVATTAMHAPEVLRRKEVTGELNFMNDLDALDAALEADNIVCRFNNPDPAGEPIDFEMRNMTPGEFAVYYQTLLGHTFLEAAAGTPTPDTELDDQQRQRIEDELTVKKYDQKLLMILEGCIQSPVGVTAERMRKWDPFYIMSLHNALMKGADRQKRSLGFLTWMQQPENREEVLALYYTARDNDRQPSYYAFGPNLPLTSQYEIDLYVNTIGKEHEAELAREADQRAAAGRN